MKSARQPGSQRNWLRISSALHDSQYRNKLLIASPIDIREGTSRRPGESLNAVKATKCLGIRRSFVTRTRPLEAEADIWIEVGVCLKADLHAGL
jgi:hypothetical protein